MGQKYLKYLLSILVPVKPYRTPPSSNIQSSSTQNYCGVVSFFFFCIYFFTICFFSIENFVILRVKYFIHYRCIYRNVIPQNSKSLLRLVVAKSTFAVWFHAILYALPQIKSVEFMDADSNVYGPFTKMSSTYDVVNFKTINFNVGDEPPFDAVNMLCYTEKMIFHI